MTVREFREHVNDAIGMITYRLPPIATKGTAAYSKDNVEYWFPEFRVGTLEVGIQAISIPTRAHDQGPFADGRAGVDVNLQLYRKKTDEYSYVSVSLYNAPGKAIPARYAKHVFAVIESFLNGDPKITDGEVRAWAEKHESKRSISVRTRFGRVKIIGEKMDAFRLLYMFSVRGSGATERECRIARCVGAARSGRRCALCTNHASRTCRYHRDVSKLVRFYSYV